MKQQIDQSLPSIIIAWRNMMDAEKAASSNTLKAYVSDISDFAAFLRKKNLDLQTAQLQELKAFLKELDYQGIASRSRARKISAFRQFYQFLVQENIRDDNPAQGLTLPKIEQNLPKFLSFDEVDALFKAAEEATGTTAIRLRCMLEIMYGCGLRVQELVSLPVTAISRDFMFLIVRGKGEKERAIPLTDPAVDLIKQWLVLRGQTAPKKTLKRDGTTKSPFLFPSRGKEGHISRIRFFQLLKELAVQANLDPDRVSPHVLRHSFATHLLAGGANLRELQIILGHSDITTTQIYTHIINDRLKNMVQELHPMAQDSQHDQK